MNKLSFYILLSAVATLTFAQPYQSQDVLLELPFDGSIIDESPLQNTLSIGGSPASVDYDLDRDGTPGALSLDGNSYINIPTSNFNNLAAYTIAFWAKPEDNSGTYTIISKVTPSRDYAIEFKNGSYKSNHTLASSGSIIGFNIAGVQPEATWAHIAYSYDGTDLKFYLNGQLENTQTQAGPINAIGTQFKIGAFGSGILEYKGLLDDFLILNKALSDQEVAELAAFNSNLEDLLLYVPFDGSTTDMSNISNTLVPAGNGITYGDDVMGMPNQAGYFDGSSWIDITSSANFNNINPYTISFFAKPTVSSGANVMFCKHTSGRDFIIEYNAGRFVNNHTEAGVGGIKSVNDPNPSDVNEWHHIAYSFDGTTIKYYVDGFMVNSRVVEGTPNGTGSVMLIGAFSPGSLVYTGYMDELKVYDRALSDLEIVSSAQIVTSNYSFADAEDEQSLVFPNPATDALNFDRSNINSFQIVNLLGAVVLEGHAQNGLSISDLARGTYTILLQGDTNTWSQKLIVR